MGTHPNAMLLAVLTPEGLARATMRSILDHCGVKEDDDIVIPIGAERKVEPEMPPVPMKLFHSIMEQSYDDGWQISAKEGDLVFFELVTYGYGEHIAWANLEAKKVVLDEWCKDVCARFNCSHEIRVSANYW